MTRKVKFPQRVEGPYIAIGHRILDHPAFQALSFSAVCLLLEVARQHNGANNGHYLICANALKKRGWKSAGTVQKAKDELIAAGFIVQTRQGGLNIGPSRFALGWYPIQNWQGLDIREGGFVRGGWHFDLKLATVPRNHSSENRNQTDSKFGLINPSVDSITESLEAENAAALVPKSGNNLITIPQPNQRKGRMKKVVVGKRGKSGVRKEHAPASAEAPKGPLAIWRIGESS